MKRLKVGLVAALLVVLGAAGAVRAQQSNVTNAVVIAALQAMGLFGDGYATGDVPVWSATATQYQPSSGSTISGLRYYATTVTTNCADNTLGYSWTSDPDTGLAKTSTAGAWVLCGNGTARLGFIGGELRLGQFLTFTSDIFAGTNATYIFGQTAHTIQLRNSTNAYRLDVANTYTSSTNNEMFSVDWQTMPNVARVGTRTAATGTRRALQLVAQDSNGADAYLMWQLDRTTAPLMRFGYYNAALTAQSTSPTEFIRLADYINTATSGTVTNVTITPTYNQAAATTANTDLLVNRTETSVGSGAQRLLDLQVGSSTRLNVTNGGVMALTDGSTTFTFTYGSGHAVLQSSSAQLRFFTSGSERFAVTTTGNISTQTSLGGIVEQLQSTATNDDPTEVVTQGRAATTDATPTTINTITIPTSTSTLIECRVVARRTGGASGAAEDGGGWYVWVAVKNTAGTVAEYAAETTTTVGESTAGFNVTAAPSGATELIQVTGAGTTNITWHSTCRTYGVNQ